MTFICFKYLLVIDGKEFVGERESKSRAKKIQKEILTEKKLGRSCLTRWPTESLKPINTNKKFFFPQRALAQF